MGLSQLVQGLFLLLMPVWLFSDVSSNRIMYLIHTEELEKALEEYHTCRLEKGKHDFALLQQLSLTLLDKGIKNSSPEIQLMTIFGAGISSNEKAFYLLEEGLHSSNPQIQIAALNFLARTQNDYSNILINKLVAAPHPLIRLEAAYQLALKKAPQATAQIEALMYKMDDDIIPIFPKLFAASGDEKAMKMLRKLLTHPDGLVRCEAILALAESGRDDLLPSIRMLASHQDIDQQEACAYALGVLKDEASIPTLKRLAHSANSSVRLAACAALNQFDDTELNERVIELAKAGDLFAIYALADFQGTEEVLAKFTKSSNLQIRINAAYALLKKQDSRCFEGLKEILISDHRDLAFTKILTPGKSLSAIKIIPCSFHNAEEASILQELSLSFREEILEACLELDEATFLKLASVIFENRQNDLIPFLTDLLVNLESSGSIALLKKEQQKAGAPLIRNYCNLALYRMGEEGPYEKNLCAWIKEQQAIDLMKFRAFVPLDMRDKEASYVLTPEETARLMISSLECIAQAQESKGIELLLEALVEGNSKNRYVLAGLLLRATQ